MTNPITPPPELVQQWVDAYFGGKISQSNFHLDLATRAAQWGADQELEACLRLVEIDAGEDAYDFARYIRAARRPSPKPLSLKEQAFLALEALLGPTKGGANAETIRRALEQLDD
jgi:hypothetical protein